MERTGGDWKGQTGENFGLCEAHCSADSCRTSYTGWTARDAHTMSSAPAAGQEARMPCTEGGNVAGSKGVAFRCFMVANTRRHVLMGKL
jgi:hypothetical protein